MAPTRHCSDACLRRRGSFAVVLGRIAVLLVVGAGCGRGAEPEVPVPRVAVPSVDAALVVDAAPRKAGPRYLVGETCMMAALGGPHFFPLFAGGDIEWTAEQAVARAPVSMAPQHFNVLGVDGQSHGDFMTKADAVSSAPRGFEGEYRGVWGMGPCTYLRGGKRVTRVDCGTAGGCGISIAVSGSSVQPLEPHAIAQVCVVDGSLIGDLDGDGAVESFPLRGLRGQGAIEGARSSGSPCATPRFAWYRLPVGADVLDLLGVVDLDRDGHLELLIAYTPAGGPRTVSLYTPAQGPTPRLERRASVVR